MSHCGEASMKYDKKVCDFCPIITPLDYTATIIWHQEVCGIIIEMKWMMMQMKIMMLLITE